MRQKRIVKKWTGREGTSKGRERKGRCLGKGRRQKREYMKGRRFKEREALEGGNEARENSKREDKKEQ